MTNECLGNIDIYNFLKGNNYTIFIKYLFIKDDFGEGYYYPSYRFYSEDEGNKIVTIIIIASSIAFIILIMSLIFIIRYCKKKNKDSELIDKTLEIKNESLF